MFSFDIRIYCVEANLCQKKVTSMAYVKILMVSKNI